MSEDKQKILIVDDTPANIQILNEALKDDYEIYFAINGKDALRTAQTVIPDLVLLDIMMPGMDGYEVCGALKRNSLLKDIPIIFITALDQEDHETRGLELGAVDYITKPFNTSIVRLRVTNHMELKRYRDALALQNEELRKALSKIKTLSGLLPICASCKKIRDDKGYWSQIEAYVSRHTEAEFSHGICPDCAKNLYPDLYDELYPEIEPDGTLRVLLAEDNAINREVMRMQLQRLGHAADSATNGVEVLEILQCTVYDVILMDCQMPEMDGWEATRVIRGRERQSQQKPAYIIAMTADTTQEARDQCLAAGMDDYLTKPVEEAELRKALERCRQTGNPGSSEGGKGWSQPELDQVIPSVDQPFLSEEAPPATMNDHPVDMERLEEISGCKPGRLHELVGLYLLQADELIGGARTAIKAGAAAEVARLVHKLVGSSSTCGMKAIVPPLQELERRAKQGQLCGADQLLDEAKQKLGSIQRLIVDRFLPIGEESTGEGHEKNPDH